MRAPLRLRPCVRSAWVSGQSPPKWELFFLFFMGAELQCIRASVSNLSLGAELQCIPCGPLEDAAQEWFPPTKAKRPEFGSAGCKFEERSMGFRGPSGFMVRAGGFSKWMSLCCHLVAGTCCCWVLPCSLQGPLLSLLSLLSLLIRSWLWEIPVGWPLAKA